VTPARFSSALKNRLARSAHCSSLSPDMPLLTCANEHYRNQIATLGGHTRSVWTNVARPRGLEGSALVKFTVRVVPGPRFPAEVEILMPGVAVGPPALVSLERAKRTALVRRDDEVATLCGQRHALIFDHD